MRRSDNHRRRDVPRTQTLLWETTSRAHSKFASTLDPLTNGRGPGSHFQVTHPLTQDFSLAKFSAVLRVWASGHLFSGLHKSLKCAEVGRCTQPAQPGLGEGQDFQIMKPRAGLQNKIVFLEIAQKSEKCPFCSQPMLT